MDKRLQEVARFSPHPQTAIEFYKMFLGLKPLWETKDGAQFAVGDIKVLVHKIASSEGSPAEDHLAVAVDDLDGVCADLKSKGLHIEKPPHKYDWGRSAYLKDPDGRWLELYEKK